MQNNSTPGLLNNLAVLGLRLIIGWGFIFHGAIKLIRGTGGFEKLLTQTGVPFAHVNAEVGPWLELIGGIAVLTGAFVRIVSFPLAIIMIIAMLTIHIHYGFSSVNTIALSAEGPVFGPPGYEINLLYLAGLFSLMVTGAGRFSIDHLRHLKINRQVRAKHVTALTGLVFVVILSFTCKPVSASQSTGRINTLRSDTSIRSAGIPLEPTDISPLLIGEKLPGLILEDQDNKMTDLTKTIVQPTILVFYRGGWCPYCVGQLKQLERIKPLLEQSGYRLLAVSTDSPEHLKKTSEKEKLTFTLLSDADLSLAKAMGIAYKAPAVYDKFLPETSGGKNIAKLLPVPSVFIFGKTGAIEFEYINPDFKQRMSSTLLTEIAAAIARQAEF